MKVKEFKGLDLVPIIKEAIKNGANTIDEVSKTTGACTGSCHGFRCKSKIEDLIKDSLK